MSKRIQVLTIAFLSIAIDQVSKMIAKKIDIAQLNQGGILGLLPQISWELVTGVILLGVCLYAYKTSYQSKWKVLGIGILIGSGISNLVDRVLFNGVWDWIYYPYINVVGNIADVLLGVAVILLIIDEHTNKPDTSPAPKIEIND